MACLVRGRDRIRTLLAGCILVLWMGHAHAQEDTLEPPQRDADRVLRLPYAFWNESFGASFGYVYAVSGYPQPRSALLGTVMAGDNGAVMGFVMGQDIRLFGVDRLFFDPIVSVGHYDHLDAYVDGNPAFPDSRAGSNTSDAKDFITGRGSDTFFRFRVRYLLPMGSGRDHVVPDYRFSEGLLTGGASGATAWNPRASGRTYLEVRPFYRAQDIRNDDVAEEQSTNGLEFGVSWDNRDYPGNPSRGNSMTLKATRDWGWGDSSASWTNFSAEYDHYVLLGEGKHFRQRVLALDFWTSCSTTWDVQPDGTIAHRPPAFIGATLGGLFRMRAFPAQRFSDKAAVYYGAELRMIPEWNPIERIPWLQERMGVEWIQLVGFAEAGRVAPEYRLDVLHEDLQWDAGLGLRFRAKGMVARVDVAWSDEGAGVQMMVGQPFQF